MRVTCSSDMRAVLAAWYLMAYWRSILRIFSDSRILYFSLLRKAIKYLSSSRAYNHQTNVEP